MAVTLTVNGTDYEYPQAGESPGWGEAAAAWATAVTSGMLQKAGGSFSLTAEVDLGATYGIKSTYFKSRTANAASAGYQRLARADVISWRNEANGADLDLGPDSSNLLNYGGDILATRDWVTTQITANDSFLELTDAPSSYASQANKVVAVNSGETAVEFIEVANANVSASAAIAYSKLALTGSILNADINASAAIAYSKLALTDSLVNADVNSSAAIAFSKMAALTASRALVSDGSGVVSVSAVTATELAQLSGVTVGGTSSGDIVTIDGSQTLTNKTITSPQLNAGLVFDQIATPSNPSSGDNKLYFKSDEKLYTLDSAGNELEVGSGGSGGGVNYIDDSNAESGIGSWATYADAAATTPVDGTGGTANITFAENSTTPLRGTKDFKITVDAANRQGEGFSYDFAVDKADRNKVLGIWFDVDATDANYADDDLQVFVYDVDTSTLITPTSPSGGYKIKANKYRFRVGFAPANTSSANYRLIVHVASTNATGYSVYFDNFEVGPGNQLQYGFDGIWKTYDENDVTISTSLSGGAVQYGYFQPYKDTAGSWRMKFNLGVTYTDQGGAGETITVTGITNVNFNQAVSANLQLTADGKNVAIDEAMFASGTSNFVLEYSGSYSSNRTQLSGDVALASKPTWADFDPIATLYPTTDDLAVTPWAAYTPSNTQGFGTITSRLQWRYNFDTIEITGDLTTGTITADEVQLELPNSTAISFKSSTGTVAVGRWKRDQTTSVGYDTFLLATHGDTFLNFSINADGTSSGTMTPLTGTGNFSNSSRYTIFASIPIDRNASQIPPIGLEIASDTQYGITKQQKLLTDSRASGSPLALTSSGAANVTASGITLTPGTWELKARVGYTGTATNIATVIIGATTTSATTPGVDDRDIAQIVNHNLSAANLNFAFYSRTITVTSDTTYYLVTFQTFSGGTCSVFGDFLANRIIE